jgi:farnesyl-diphosphate farnesyltransferase
MDKYEMLRQVSRTFALSIEQLPGILRDSITMAYLLLRVSDCLEDCEAIPTGDKPQLLRLWAEVLEKKEPVEHLVEKISYLDGESDAEIYVAQHAGYVLDELYRLPEDLQKILVLHVNDTSRGMARWQEHGPYVEDEAEMDDYMHCVAGIVGYLLTDVFAWYSPRFAKIKDKVMPLSREYGLGLQAVNILRGMRKDYERGWVYVPRTFYEKVGLTRDTLFLPENLDKSILVVNMLAEKAERHLANGITYLISFPAWQHHVRLACMWPLFFAVKTLALSRNNTDVILDEVKITRNQIKDIMFKTQLFGWSNNWVKHFYKELSTPAHNSPELKGSFSTTP